MLEPTAQEGCGAIGTGSEEGCEDGQRTGVLLLQSQPDGAGSVQTGKEKVLGITHGFSVFKVTL